MKYNLEIEKAVEKIQSERARKVLIQLPDGLKPKAAEIKNAIEKQTDAEVFIWLGSCFGACDVPYYTEKIGIDMIIQWGHSEWKAQQSDFSSDDSESDSPDDSLNDSKYTFTPMFG